MTDRQALLPELYVAVEGLSWDDRQGQPQWTPAGAVCVAGSRLMQSRERMWQPLVLVVAAGDLAEQSAYVQITSGDEAIKQWPPMLLAVEQPSYLSS